MDSVGGSIGWACRASVTSGTQSVSATLNLDRPAMATMSPASATSIGVRSMPRNARILETRPVSITAPLLSSTLTRLVRLDRARLDPARDEPAEIGIGLEQRAEHAERALVDGGGRHMLQHQFEQGRHALVGASGELAIQPCLPEP